MLDVLPLQLSVVFDLAPVMFRPLNVALTGRRRSQPHAN